jgi:transglutaminase-like putative cysteine protease
MRTAPPEIERIFQSALFLLVVTGFATLAGTGKLDMLSVAFVLLALGLRGILLLRNVNFVIPQRITVWLALVYVVLFFVDFFFISGRDFVTPSVHLVLFGMCVKLFSIERERDYVYLAVLSFLMVLASAILTVDSAFFAAFALFLLLAVFCFMAMEMRRSALKAANTAPLAIPGLRTRRRQITPLQRMAGALARTTIVMVLAILLGGTALFFAMPRVSGGYLSRYAQSDLISTGFSETVSLGAIGQIQQSSEVVAHVHIEGDTTGYRLIRLRGAVLTQFDGKRWSNPQQVAMIAQGYGRAFQLPPRAQRQPRTEYQVARGPSVDAVRYRVLMEPLSTNIIFTIPAAEAIFGTFRQIGVDADQTFRNLDRERPVNMYEGVSDVSLPLPTRLDRLSVALPDTMPARYLQLPEKLDPRIPELARSITAKESSTYRRATAIDRYLTTHFGYTLQLPSEAPADPLADFLFHRRRGHCEYFASSMAIMLRSVGIPSRVVTGFRGAQFNQVNSTYIVRARDAHSWVEAYIPGAGWTTFDPTPPGDAPMMTPWSRAQLYLDAAHEFWREWVVNYDAAHQQTLSMATVHSTRNRMAQLRQWSAAKYEHMLEMARRVHRTATEEPQKLMRPTVRVLVVMLLLALSILVVRVRNFRRMASVRRSPVSAAALLYQRMTQRLARSGYPRPAAQTAEEFAAQIAEAPLREAVLRFIAEYQHARFGASSSAAETLPGLLEQVRRAARS